MRDKINLDDLLKQELGSLSPEPPADVWQGINNNLPTSSPVASTGVQGGISLTAKVIGVVVATVSAVATVTYLVVTTPKDGNPNPVVSKVVESPVLSSQPKNDQNLNVENAALADKFDNTSEKNTGTKPVSKGTAIPTRRNTESKSSSERQESGHSTNRVAMGSGSVTSGGVVPARNADNHQTEEPKAEEPKGDSEASNQDGSTSVNATLDDAGFNKPEVPNVFTPNNDGFNDEYVIGIEDEVLFDLKITDAKGNVMFESRDKNVHWKGMNPKTGNLCEPGTYILAFRYQLRGMKDPKVIQGRVLLKL